MIVFPHAANCSIGCSHFVAAWQALEEGQAPPSEDGLRTPILVAARYASLASQLRSGRSASLDVLCRRLVPPRYRNTTQATSAFFAANQHAVVRYTEPNPDTGRNVFFARLTPEVLGEWHALLASEREELLVAAHALLSADADIEGSAPEVVGVLDPIETVSPSATAIGRAPIAVDRTGYLRSLVDDIATDPWTPVYRRRPAGAVKAIGWPARLSAYFWPTPMQGFAYNVEDLQPLLDRATLLARVVEHGGRWDAAQRESALKFAHAVFKWGGVPQDSVTAAQVEAVFVAAIHGSVTQVAPMNSGWTKIAAFATAHREPDGAHVIWDSRVAASVVHRLEAQATPERGVHLLSCFPDLGRVEGRIGVGLRRQEPATQRWPNGYRSWPAQFAASAVVREIRDLLNAHPDQYGRMPWPGVSDAGARWTVRGVEMVLFMDGY